MLQVIELTYWRTKFALAWYLWAMIDGSPYTEPRLALYWRKKTFKDCFKKG